MATARSPVDSRRQRPWAALAAALTAGGMAAAHAQSQPYGFDAFVGLGLLATDNVDLAATGERSDASLSATAGVRGFARSEFLSGNASYSLTRLQYARASERNQWVHALDALGSAELWRQHAFLDVAASASQQHVSALGVQTVDPERAASNRTQTAQLQVAPRLQGRLGDFADAAARLGHTITRYSDQTAGDQSSTSALLTLAGVPRGRVGWGLEASANRIDYKEARPIRDDIVRGTLSVQATIDLVLTAIGGRESNNYESEDKRSRTLWGAAAEWTPSGRTRVAARAERRFFGTAHSVQATYRTPRTVWSFTDRRDTSNSVGTQLRSIGTALDLMSLQLAGEIADPVLRLDEATRLLELQGIDPAAQVFGRFITPTATLGSTQQLSALWLGQRTTVTLTLARSSTRRLDTLSPLSLDLAANESIREVGATAQAAYRLTAQTSLNAQASERRNKGLTTGESNRLRALRLGMTTQLGPRSSASFSAGTSSFSSDTSPYRENTLSAHYRLEL